MSERADAAVPTGKTTEEETGRTRPKRAAGAVAAMGVTIKVEYWYL